MEEGGVGMREARWSAVAGPAILRVKRLQVRQRKWSLPAAAEAVLEVDDMDLSDDRTDFSSRESESESALRAMSAASISMLREATVASWTNLVDRFW